MLRVDGGASVSDVMLRFQSDLLRIPVDRPKMVETTGLRRGGAGGPCRRLLAEHGRGARPARERPRVLPRAAQAECDEKYRLWKRAVSCACGWIEKA